uniref:F-box protein n=1 Tax=Cucumis melo TaxID=3656 RepID=A0A1S3C6G9_CUCME
MITLTMLPESFTRYSCDRNIYVQFSIGEFYSKFMLHKRRGYDSLTLICLAEFRFHMALEFHSSSIQQSPSPQLLHTWQQRCSFQLMGKINYKSFVSFKLYDFRRLVVIFNDTRTYIPFRVSKSEFKFFIDDRQFVFSTERNECIIGGIRKGKEMKGAMTLSPKEAYFNCTSKRLWLFESNDPSGQEDPFNKKELPMSIVAEPVDVGDVDYGSFFVSMALEEFRCVVNDMENAAYVPVTITSSRIKFVALIDHWETSFTTKEGECIIGGIEEGQEIKCGISLYPMKFYKAFTSKRVWFFSSCDTNGLLLIAPMGVYTHISSFFPQEIISYVRNTFT